MHTQCMSIDMYLLHLACSFCVVLVSEMMPVVRGHPDLSLILQTYSPPVVHGRWLVASRWHRFTTLHIHGLVYRSYGQWLCCCCQLAIIGTVFRHEYVQEVRLGAASPTLRSAATIDPKNRDFLACFCGLLGTTLG